MILISKRYKKPVRTLCMQALFLLGALYATAAKAQNPSIKDIFVTVKIQKEPAYTTVSFTPSARFYKLMKSNKHYFYYLSILRSSEKNKTAVIIKRANVYTDTILAVEPYHKK